MSKMWMAGLVSGLAGAATGAPVFLSFTGTVVDVTDPSGLITGIAVGDASSGTFGFDDEAPDLTPAEPGVPFAFYEALSIDVQAGSNTFTTEQPVVLVFDDIDLTADQSGDLVLDALLLGGGLSDGSARTGQITFNFTGDSIWFDGRGLPSPDTFGLENLFTAGVIIEFSQVIGDPFDDEGNPVDPGDLEVVSGTATVQIETIRSAGGVIATIGCSVAQLAAPVARADVFDIIAFFDAYASDDASADLRADGSLDVFDIIEFFDAFATCAG